MKTDNIGNVTYSDMPMKNAKTIALPGETHSENTQPNTNVAEKKPKADSKLPYTTFRIISPVDQDTIQNQPTLIVDIKVAPNLQEQDKIQIYVDGKRMGVPVAQLKIDVGQVDRGTHELYAEIVDKNQRNIMQSNVITIYLHQAHTGAPPPSQPSPQRAPHKPA